MSTPDQCEGLKAGTQKKCRTQDVHFFPLPLTALVAVSVHRWYSWFSCSSGESASRLQASQRRKKTSCTPVDTALLKHTQMLPAHTDACSVLCTHRAGGARSVSEPCLAPACSAASNLFVHCTHCTPLSSMPSFRLVLWCQACRAQSQDLHPATRGQHMDRG